MALSKERLDALDVMSSVPDGSVEAWACPDIPAAELRALVTAYRALPDALAMAREARELLREAREWVGVVSAQQSDITAISALRRKIDALMGVR